MRRASFTGVLVLFFSLVIGLGGCQSERVPAPGSQEYKKAVTSFYTGASALQVGENYRAEQQLKTAAKLAPGEPAVWANRGLLAFQQNELETAAKHFEQACTLAPESERMQLLSGLLERERGHYEQAISHLRRAVELDSTNRAALYTLAQVIEQQGGETATQDALRLVNRLLAQSPDNLVVLVERARLAAKAGKTAMLRKTLDRLGNRTSSWPDAARSSLQAVRKVAATPPKAAAQIAFLKNDLKRTPAYQADQAAVQPPSLAERASVVIRLFRMTPPDPQPAPADTGLTFTADSLRTTDQWDWIQHVTLAEEVPPDVMMTDGETLRIETGLGRVVTVPFPGGTTSDRPMGHVATPFDMDYDFRVDLAAAGEDGVRIYRQQADSSFQNVSEEAVPAAVRGEAYAGVWPADLDMDGDLDLVLARQSAPPVTLRNNGDGTFATRSFFSEVRALRAFVWSDLDADGTPDAAMLDAGGQLHVYDNKRSGTPRFSPRILPDTLASGRGLSVGDVNRDGAMDLLLLRASGAVSRLTASSTGWETDRLLSGRPLPDDTPVSGTRLLAGDLDNNGGLDLVQATPGAGTIWLSDSTGAYIPHSEPIQHTVFSAADVRGKGRLDLLALSDSGTPLRLTNEGTKNYQSQRIQPRAARTQGDRRINPYGIGGEIELRAGLLYQKRPITEPTVHFGLGRRSGADVARIIWPNGTVQAEFNLVSTQTALARQRLKGSCPWVYTYDGEDMQFETDFLWRTALGLRINAQGKAQVIHSEDRIFIPGEHVGRRNGMYDVRITGELWESHFFDRVELVAVDHPAGTTVRIDERFHLPPPDQDLTPLAPPQPVAQAWDQDGRDVTALVQKNDGRYLDTFELGPFQGRAEEHYVEVRLGDDVPAEGPLWLVADGWVYPTDTSLNLAIGQGDFAPPTGITLEVPDGDGGWKVARSNIGFPAGKSKTMLIDLSEVVGPDGPRRVRLRTNMEIYWDRLAWAPGRPDVKLKTHLLSPDSAHLRDRGFSKVVQTERRLPTVPVYDSIATTTRMWRDLRGYHTRFGPVDELVSKTDDRYVIMNAGDEMVLRFPAPPAPPDGWTRDFVLVGDGWVKDGDFNTGHSRTVRPLPYHGMDDYSTPPGPLEEDPAYQMHPDDWETYHTRYVAPRRFHRALSFDANRSGTP
ncbi:MAG: FG-GAP-like repeat-containing protein [Salinibacter sp.]|uniref:FG-GAP-like repeat-containing protein n=1 Tax=Salinibacter sp. TaxID=2065818 RepID=UPI0035D4F6B6